MLLCCEGSLRCGLQGMLLTGLPSLLRKLSSAAAHSDCIGIIQSCRFYALALTQQSGISWESFMSPQGRQLSCMLYAG